MAASGFEGYEKRLELHFTGDDPLGLRRLSVRALEQVLHAVQCSVVTAASNHAFDAYVLSESSLFVFPNKIILKTCGTTHLLRSAPILLRHATTAGLVPTACRYTRGAFLFPKAQPFPHTSFQEEVLCLQESLPPALRHRKACVLPSTVPNHSWHVFSASDSPVITPTTDYVTVEVCMTELDREVAGNFFRRPGDKSSAHTAAKEMAELAGIKSIIPRAVVCEHAFDPCGYSMNGLDMGRYSTIHVTPEDGCSYASFECTAGDEGEVAGVLRRVADVFRPGTMSVSVTGGGGGWSSAVKAVEKAGLSWQSRAVEEFPGAGVVTYQTFTARRK